MGFLLRKGNISLNWRLILAPQYVTDYVILHELLHTRVLNHTQRFWVIFRASAQIVRKLSVRKRKRAAEITKDL